LLSGAFLLFALRVRFEVMEELCDSEAAAQRKNSTNRKPASHRKEKTLSPKEP